MHCQRITRLVPYIAAAVVIATAVGGAAWSAQTKPVTLEDLNSLWTLGGEANLSADGRWLAIEGKVDVTVIDVRTGRAIAQLGEGIVPAWSPARPRLVFYSTRSGQRQLWSWSVGDALPEQVTQLSSGIDPDITTRVAGSVADAFRFNWAPDGRHIVFASRVAFPVDMGAGRTPAAIDANPLDDIRPLVLTATTPPEWTLAGIYAHATLQAGVTESRTGRTLAFRKADPNEILFSQLFVADVERKEVRQLTNIRRSLFHASWAPDARSISCAAIDGPSLTYGTAASDIVSVDVVSGLLRVLAGGEHLKFRPKWSPDGSQFAFESAANTLERARIVVIDPVSGRTLASGPQMDRWIFDYEWSAHRAGFVVSYMDGVATRLARVTLDSPKIVELTPHDKLPYSVNAFSQSRGGAIAWRQTDPQDVVTVRYLSAEGARQKILWRLNPNTQNLVLGHVEIVNWRNGRGDGMEGTMMLPPGYNQGSRYPLIVDAYPGISGSNWATPIGGNYAWASLGYVVFRPSPRAPHTWMNPWKSYESSRAARGVAGWKVTLDDVLSGVDALIDRGIVDGDRMCLFGHSNGGGVVTNLITQTKRFRCAVILAPALADWIRPALMDTDSWVASIAGTHIEEGLNEYVSLSSVLHLSTVQTPVLIADGDNDDGFLLDSIEIYNRLRNMGKEVTFVRYPGQGHLLSGAALADFWGRELKFFARYLGD